MGSCLSKIERQEMVLRCKARKRFMKQLVHARHFLASAHSLYLRSLRSTGSALLQFATGETTLHHHPQHISDQRHHLPPLPPSPPASVPQPPTPPPPPSISPSTDTWTTSTTNSSALRPPPPIPPPPPPPAGGSTWDFWDPFVPSSSRSGTTEEEWEATTTMSEVNVTTTGAASVTAPPSIISGFSKDATTTVVSGDLAVVVSRNGKELVEIMRELDEYFLKAADAGGIVSALLEVPISALSSSHSKVYNYGRPMWWTSWGGLNGKSMNENGMMVGNGMPIGMSNGNSGSNGFLHATSHCSTVERLYAWEKKLFQEVKNTETIRMEHEKRVDQLRKLEVKRADYLKTEKTKKEVERLESQLEVASQAIETTSAEIIKIRETELYPQLLDLVKGFMSMWRSMYESHQVQTHIVDQLKFLNTFPSAEPTSELHRQSTLQLEVQLQQWLQSFCNLVKAQRDYVQSLTSWLRLSIFQPNKSPLFRAKQDSTIYSLCEEWQLNISNIPDKVASDGISSLLNVVHAIVVQQGEEHKQKKKSETANKELEKKAAQLRSLEAKYGPFSMPEMTTNRKGKNPVAEKRAKVEVLKVKVEEEKGKHEKSVSVTRALTINNLQTGLPHVFQAVTGFSRVCMDAFEGVFNQAKNMEQQQQQNDVKRLLPLP